MSFFKARFVLLALAGALSSAALVSACSGGEFTASSDATAGSGATGGSANGAGGSGMGASRSGGGSTAEPSTACAGPEDCDDGDVCTVDLCDANGTCTAAPRCLGTEKCCNGECAECCDDGDCEDGLECTQNSCFAGKCMYIPNDSACDAAQYCSTTDGCRAKQVCGLTGATPGGECDDGSPCTSDRCDGNFCKHDFCTKGVNGGLCCADGCAEECCTDSQCDDPNDPCQVGSCEGGKCKQVPLCEGGLDCCPSADRKTANCGKCCSADECDDSVGCTEDACTGGQCTHTPSSTGPLACSPGYLCDLEDNCVKAPDCETADDCHPTACQSNPRCESGSCKFEGCMGTRCCESGCAVCCEDGQCSDNIDCTIDKCAAGGCTHEPDDSRCAATDTHCDAQQGCIGCKRNEECDDQIACTADTCNPNNNTCQHVSNCMTGYCDQLSGTCIACKTNSDCNDTGVLTNALPIGGKCSYQQCNQTTHQCELVSKTCGVNEQCCPLVGCSKLCLLDTTK